MPQAHICWLKRPTLGRTVSPTTTCSPSSAPATVPIGVATPTNLAQFHPDWPNPAFHSFGISNGLVNGDTQALAEDTDGSLWVGKDGGGAARIVQDGLVTFDEADGFPPQSI